MLSRSQFETACKGFIAKRTSSAPEAWSWNEHPSRPGYGFMSRCLVLAQILRPDESDPPADLIDCQSILEEFEDKNATCDIISSTVQHLTCQQYVVYSVTFQVPAFYFTIHGSGGTPLSLADIIKTPLFSLEISEAAETTTFALTLPKSSFPVLSQGDHPTLGTPCWYLHPCETANAVAELMHEVSQEGWSELTRLVRWLEIWFMVLGTAIRVP